MSLRLLLLIGVSIVLSSAAQLILKLGTTGAAAQRGAAAELVTMLTSPLVLLGLAMYGFAALLWLFVLARAEVSFAYPFVGVGFVVTMVAGYMLLDEPVTLSRTCGTLLIALGCVLVARSA